MGEDNRGITMIRLEVIETAQPSGDAIEMLRAYAAVSDSRQDSLLMAIMRRAFSVVQRCADVALLEGRYRVMAEDHSGVVNVYMGGVVESVTDAQGVSIAYHQTGRTVNVMTERYVEVVFTTEVNADDYDRLLPVVLKYATAIYDGKDSHELNAILKEC